MTTLSYYTKRIQDCYLANSSWNESLSSALHLYTLGGDWNAEVSWIPELLAEQTSYDFDEEEVELISEEFDLSEMADTALTDWITANAVDNFFDNPPCYSVLYQIEEDERNEMFLRHAEEKGCSWKAWVFLLSEYTDWLYEQEIWTAEETLKLANKQIELATAAGAEQIDTDMLNEFVEQFTEDQA